MVTQYPHIMTITTQGESSQDADGNWQPAGLVTREQICRAEPNGSGKTVATVDGTQVAYSWTVYLPLPVQTAPYGATIEIRNGAEIIAMGKAIRFSQGQLNARLWL